ncbi:MAG: leucyl aminopeptidase [Myxococcaceae bacterium]
MNITLVGQDARRAKCDVLVLPVTGEDFKAKRGLLTDIDKALGGLLRRAAAEEGFAAKTDQSFVFHTHGRLAAARVLLLGLGAKANYPLETLRLAAGRAAKAAQRLRAKRLAFVLPSGRTVADPVRAVAEGLWLGAYTFDRYRSKGPDEKPSPKLSDALLLLPRQSVKDRAATSALALAKRISEATNWARDLVNEPGGVMTPVALAAAAAKAARAAGLRVEVSGRKEIERLKMGMFLGVAQGSVLEPKLIQIRYTPKSAAGARQAPVVLVGKAITFDSGGLSLKPADGMVDMKTDMAGSAAVFAAMQVIAALKPSFPVHAYVGTCENMPSGTAYRPGDVLISRLGKTVEITNTDAEGRLVLGDILSFANEKKPAAIVDLATLTGACMVALGHYIVGAFGADDALMEELLVAAKSAGEEFWRLPMSDLQKDALRSDIADMKNSGERWGGAINAALFLKEFVGKTPWVHLDIAGPSQSPKERGYNGKGATGVGVRTLVEWVMQRDRKKSR